MFCATGDASGPLAGGVAHVDRAGDINAVRHDIGGPREAVGLLVAAGDGGDAVGGEGALLPRAERDGGGGAQVAVGDEGAVEEDGEGLVDAVEVEDVGGWVLAAAAAAAGVGCRVVERREMGVDVEVGREVLLPSGEGGFNHVQAGERIGEGGADGVEAVDDDGHDFG